MILGTIVRQRLKRFNGTDYDTVWLETDESCITRQWNTSIRYVNNPFNYSIITDSNGRGFTDFETMRDAIWDWVRPKAEGIYFALVCIVGNSGIRFDIAVHLDIGSANSFALITKNYGNRGLGCRLLGVTNNFTIAFSQWDGVNSKIAYYHYSNEPQNPSINP